MTASRFTETAIALLVFVAALAHFHQTLHLTFELRDEGFLLLNIARAAEGDVPHRDFAEVYGPGFYAVTAPVFRVFGGRVLAIRELLAVLRAAAVVFAYLIARQLVPRPFALLGAFFAMGFWGWAVWSVNTPYAALFTIPLCMLSLLILLIGESRDSRAAYLASGFVCGAALLFKWSLAAVSAYGMVLAICASAMLREPATPGPRALRVAVLLGWLLAGAAILVPFRSTLAPFDYLLHFAPVHALIALVALRFARSGDGRSALARATPRVARYGAGLLVPPVLVAIPYLAWGSLGDLLYDTVYRPLHYRNYYMPIRVPPLGSAALLLCLACLTTGALALLRGSRRVALAFTAAGMLLAPFGYRSVQVYGSVPLSLERLLLQLPAITAFAALAVVAAMIARPRTPASERLLPAVIAALFFHEMMTFQIFPRGGYNATFMLGALAPCVAFLAHRWCDLATAGSEPPARSRRVLAFVLVALLPALYVAERVQNAIRAPRPQDLAHHALRSPALAGIRPGPETWERLDLASFDALIARIEAEQPADAPLFVVNNEPMIYFASGRDPLFEEHLLILFLAGWNLLPESDRDLPSTSSLIEKLERSPDAVLVTRRRDKTVRNLSTFFPPLAEYIAEKYRVEARVGDYRILRRAEAR